MKRGYAFDEVLGVLCSCEGSDDVNGRQPVDQAVRAIVRFVRCENLDTTVLTRSLEAALSDPELMPSRPTIEVEVVVVKDGP